MKLQQRKKNIKEIESIQEKIANNTTTQEDIMKITDIIIDLLLSVKIK